jgi:DNA-directed RNA polymerase subunit RPC12/RpoP
MKFSTDNSDSSRRRRRSSHEREPFFGVDPQNGAPIRCQYCTGQSFRRSSLRSQDLTEILLMRYPVRCLRCSQRQLVSFTVAGLSISSSIKINKRRHRNGMPAHWKDPFKGGGSDQSQVTSNRQDR